MHNTIRGIYWYLRFFLKRVIFKKAWGYMADDARYYPKMNLRIARKIFMYENTNISPGCELNISPYTNARFIMKKHSGMATGVTIIVGNHSIAPSVGTWRKDSIMKKEGDVEQDVVIEEDVWIGANATLLSGVTLGRGSVVGAGAVVRNSVPPYSIVMGNPSKIIGFCLTPHEVIEHEKALYSEEERLPLELLEKNYDKYFISKIKEIKAFMRLSM